MGWSLAVIVYLIRPDRAQNRWLALLLALGASFAGPLTAGRLLFPDLQTARAFYLSAMSASLFLPPVYVEFVATLRSPMARVLASRPVRWTFWAAAGAMFLVSLFLPAVFRGQPVFRAEVGTWVFQDPLPAVWLYAGVLLPVYFLGFVVALLGLRQAFGSLRRAQARAYAAAFGAHDFIVMGTLVGVGVLYDAGNPLHVQLVFILFPLAEILFAVLLAYGVFKVHLFDIDIKLKRGFARGVLATVLVGTVLVVGQVIQNATTDAFGVMGGAVTAGLLLLAIRPLDRAANRLADAAMPSVNGTADYIAFRKMEVYKAAVEELAVGGVTTKERRALDALCAKLGIAAPDAKAMERDLRSTMGMA